MPASDRDRPLNIGFEVYRPVRPVAGKVRGENLLWHSLMHAGCLERWDDALHLVQRQRGRDQVVWGIHFDIARRALAWEFRVLAPALAQLREELGAHVELAPTVEAEPERCAVVAFGFDAETEGRIPTVDFHVRDAEDPRAFEILRCGAGEPERVSYDLLREPKREIEEVLAVVKASEVVDFAAHPRLLGRAMIPELFACRRLHISKRAGRDALCFSGVNVEQLAFTYKRFELPPELLAFLTEHQAQLEHLLYDVSVEYRATGAQIEYPSVAIYGCL